MSSNSFSSQYWHFRATILNVYYFIVTCLKVQVYIIIRQSPVALLDIQIAWKNGPLSVKDDLLSYKLGVECYQIRISTVTIVPVTSHLLNQINPFYRFSNNCRVPIQNNLRIKTK